MQANEEKGNGSSNEGNISENVVKSNSYLYGLIYIECLT